MSSPFLMHVLVALVWIFLSGDTTLSNLVFALGATFLLLAVFRKPLRCQDYIRRTLGFARFLVRLLADIVMSNLRIMRVVLRRNAGDIQGGFVPYSVDGLTDFEILLVSLCVGLSPGTITVEHEPQQRQLILHVFPHADPETVRRHADRVLKHGILSFTR